MDSKIIIGQPSPASPKGRTFIFFNVLTMHMSRNATVYSPQPKPLPRRLPARFAIFFDPDHFYNLIAADRAWPGYYTLLLLLRASKIIRKILWPPCLLLYAKLSSIVSAAPGDFQRTVVFLSHVKRKGRPVK
jgi:hypothetical protein